MVEPPASWPLHVHMGLRRGAIAVTRRLALPSCCGDSEDFKAFVLQVLSCSWNNGVCEAWKTKNEEMMQKLQQVKCEKDVVVID